jgi:hypothetical protein
MKAYVYIWFKPDWSPFYVGIGKTRNRWNPVRAKAKDRNEACMRTIAKYGAENIKVQRMFFDTWEDACTAERSLIACFGRHDSGGVLYNFTDGGEGNINPPAAEREAKRLRLLDPNNPLRQQHKKLNTTPEIHAKRVSAIRSPEVQAKISAALNDPEKKAARLAKLRATIASPEYQDKLALRRNPKPVKRTPEELREYRRKLLTERNKDPEYNTKRVAALKQASLKISEGVKQSAEVRAATMKTPEVQAKLRRPKTAEQKQKISESQKLRWAERKAMSST